ncbi:dUTP diphosphatase [Salinicoccus sesuvii]|uniref:dUTP diphosphatase n=1 Tax=Salinicoccus sesuvii TaxID=868281 RepID=A0ABV7N6Y4_9STAP
MNTLKIKKLHPDAIVPTRAHKTDAGLDLYANESVPVTNGTKISTGIAVDIPEGFEGTIRPRSGLTSKTRLRVQLGTIDAGYNGEVKVIVDYGNDVNFDEEKMEILKMYHKIRKGDKIAQLVISPIVTPKPIVVEDFDSESARGANGFGSTGR